MRRMCLATRGAEEQGELEGNLKFLFRRWIEKETRLPPVWQGKLWAIEIVSAFMSVDRWGSCDGIPPAPGAGVVPLTECPVAQAGINRMLTPLRSPEWGGPTGGGGTAVLQESTDGDVFVSLRGPWKEGTCDLLIEKGFRGVWTPLRAERNRGRCPFLTGRGRIARNWPFLSGDFPKPIPSGSASDGGFVKRMAGSPRRAGAGALLWSEP